MGTKNAKNFPPLPKPLTPRPLRQHSQKSNFLSVVAIGISTSFEQFLDFVGTNFNLLLNRNPSALTAAAYPSSSFITPTDPTGVPPPTDPVSQGEQGYWADALNNGLTDGDFKADIIASAEWIHDQGL